jgi:hypothetical protein
MIEFMMILCLLVEMQLHWKAEVEAWEFEFGYDGLRFSEVLMSQAATLKFIEYSRLS